MIKQKINNIKIEKVDTGKEKKILHKDIFDYPYVNVFLCGPSGSGKTTFLYNMLKHMTFYNDTLIIIVSTTHNDDKTMMKIKEDFGETNDVVVYDALNKETFDEIIKLMKDQTEEDLHPKYIYARTILIIDDVKDFLRDPKMYDIASKIRHYKAHLFILSQYFKDITPALRSQLRFLILFKGWGLEKLKEIYKSFISNIDFQTFVLLYNDATHDKDSGEYGCLYISLIKTEYRRNLNEQYNIDK
jgi:KaiC/GvpD/RAD55 family RecA-like ATPase